jgi:hypothetical protein
LSSGDPARTPAQWCAPTDRRAVRAARPLRAPQADHGQGLLGFDVDPRGGRLLVNEDEAARVRVGR